MNIQKFISTINLLFEDGCTMFTECETCPLYISIYEDRSKNPHIISMCKALRDCNQVPKSKWYIK